MTRDSEMDIDVPKQRARKRRRQGLRSVRIWLPVTDIDYFLRLVLTEKQRQRPDALQTELAGLIRQILDEMRDARAGYR